MCAQEGLGRALRLASELAPARAAAALEIAADLRPALVNGAREGSVRRVEREPDAAPRTGRVAEVP